MKSLLLVLTVLLSSSLSQATGPAPAMDVTIAVATDSGPFASLDENKNFIGLDVDVVRAACTEQKWNCQFIEIPFQDLMSGLVGYAVLDSGVDYTKPFPQRWDLAVGALDAKTSRLKFMRFSNPYFSGRHLFLERIGKAVAFDAKSGFPIPSAKNPITIGVQKGSALHGELQMAYGRFPREGVKIVTYVNLDELKVMAPQIDAIFTFTGGFEKSNADTIGFSFPSGNLVGVVDASQINGVAVGVVDNDKGKILAAGINQALDGLFKGCDAGACGHKALINSHFGELPFDPSPKTIPVVEFPAELTSN